MDCAESNGLLLDSHAETTSHLDDAKHLRRLILVGNPNVGKSLLFTRLTRRYVTVANYPGTTVELTMARGDFGDQSRLVIDTPGACELSPRSDDERVTSDLLFGEAEADVALVGDVNAPRRTLLLAIQLAEHERRFAVCFNMADESKAAFDPAILQRAIGARVVLVSALREWNIDELKEAALHPLEASIDVDYGSLIEKAVEKIRRETGMNRGEALMRLETTDRFEEERRILETTLGEPLSYVVAKRRNSAVDRLLEISATGNVLPSIHPLRDRLGWLSMHPIWGYPILGLILYLGWLFVGSFGAGTLVDLIETKIFEEHINVWAIGLVDALAQFPHQHVLRDGIVTSAYQSAAAPPAFAGFLHDLLIGPYGVITMALTYAVAIVLPVVITFFFFFGLLEDSGYLPRLAVMLHRTFRTMGLNGKAVLPMVLGLGCDTMATLTTRILETRKERVIVTILLALAVPCSAQLAVIVAMLAGVGGTGVAIWGGVLIGTLFLIGYLASKLVRGDASDFILEIPPLRVPKISNILIKVSARAEWYLREAVPLFILGTVLLYVLDITNLLKGIQTALAPLVVGALGLPAEAANAFVVGFLRRDYGAAGLFMMQKAGSLTVAQTIVALTVVTLFIPCIANFLVMLKERGTRTALAIAGFVIVYSFSVGAILNFFFRLTGWGAGS